MVQIDLAIQSPGEKVTTGQLGAVVTANCSWKTALGDDLVEHTRKLYLVELTTHEKVVIVDDRIFVNSSFNWLSYSGTDGRRETGTVLRGRLSHLRDRFLADMYKKLMEKEAVAT